MKNFYRYIILFTLSTILIIGCKKDEETPTESGNNNTSSTVMDTNDVAEAVAKSLVSKDAGYGFCALVAGSSKKSNGIPGPESPAYSLVDTNFAIADSGLYASYAYSANLKIKFIYKGQEKDVYSPLYDTAKINFKAFGTAKTTGGRVSYIDTSYLGQTYLTGLSLAGSTFKLNGEFYYYGAFIIKVVNTKNFIVEAHYTFSNIAVSKTDYKITGGSMSVNVKATTSNKIIEFTGTITFLGNKQATLQVGNKQWTISWENGNIQLVG